MRWVFAAILALLAVEVTAGAVVVHVVRPALEAWGTIAASLP
jgi:hypothetical protein